LESKATVYDLAVQVVLYLVAFQRRVAEGESPTYDDTCREVLRLLKDLDEQSHRTEGLHDHWVAARVPLVYLVDEVMILNCPWEHRNEWANNCLEVALLGHPQALGGENFYTECEEALRELEVAERHERRDYAARVELMMVYYVALQMGFKGRYALDLDAWREFKAHLFSKLPSYAQTRTKQLFPETDQHTVLLDPNYEPVTRLLYVFLAFLFIVALYFGATWGYWSDLTSDLAGHVKTVGAVPAAVGGEAAREPAAEPDAAGAGRGGAN